MTVAGVDLLSSQNLLFSSIAIAIALVFAWRFFFTRKKNKQPGGLTHYPILGCLPSLIKNRHRFHEWMADVLAASPSNTCLCRRPGGIRGYITSNPKILEYMLRANFENYEKGERSRSILHDFMGNGIFNANGEVWKMQRKVASYEFNTKSLRNFVVETVQSEILHRLMPLLSNACSEGVSINLQDVLQRFAFDNICSVAFGFDPGYLDTSMPEIPFARAFDDATELSFRRFLYSVPFLWRIKRMLNLGSERRLGEAIRVVDGFVTSIIHSRRTQITESQGEGSNLLRNDLLSRFMATVIDWNQMDTDSDKLIVSKGTASMTDKSDVFLRHMIVNFMLAGRDTTSTSLTWFFWVLSSHPTVEAAIHREIMEVKAKRGNRAEASEISDENKGITFTYEELKEMQYLHAALCESLRLYPSVPLDSKVALQDDVLPDGSVVKKGWIVDYSIYAMGRMESIWGGDCKEFKPERWFRNGEFVGENPYKFAAFNAGPRICLGKEMAFIQMKSIVASIIHNFSLNVDSDFVPSYILDFIMRMKGGMPVTVRAR
uniref:Cytochrome P450 n=1 Tax=Araucaria cunninghamii TaxID=56994 RepID=A0A0D6QRG8_ARACU